MDFLLEKNKAYYMERWQINKNKWEQNRLVSCLVFALVVFFIVVFVLKIMTMIPAIIVSIVVFFAMFKFSYFNLTQMDVKIESYLGKLLPNITVTFVALSAYFDSVINVLETSKVYVNDKYYSIRIDEFLEEVKNDPDNTDEYIFNLFKNIPSANGLFLARTIVDSRKKGYDMELMSTLIKSVSTEAEVTNRKLLEAIPLEFVKFATFPILFTLLLMFMMVMSLTTYAQM
ncbi:MAG: hypothetical protein ACK5HR_05590 [Mycoplasmatales bacterium]